METTLQKNEPEAYLAGRFQAQVDFMEATLPEDPTERLAYYYGRRDGQKENACPKAKQKGSKVKQLLTAIALAPILALSVIAFGAGEADASAATKQLNLGREIVERQIAGGYNDAVSEVFYTSNSPLVVGRIFAYADAACVGFLNEDFSCSGNLPEGEAMDSPGKLSGNVKPRGIYKQMLTIQLREGFNDSVLEAYYGARNPALQREIRKSANAWCNGRLNEDFSCSKKKPQAKPRKQFKQSTPVADGTVNVGEVSEERWNELIARGWKGDPNDSEERLYAPGS